MANVTDKSILTAAGKALLAQLNAEEKALVIDKMIFANVPNRPEYPQPDDVVPSNDVVHEAAVEQRGRLSVDSVIYSTTLTSQEGPFEFNWTGAYCSEYGVLVTIDHHALTPKTADEPGVSGNTLVRSVVLEYKDIAEITNITVDASTWQYNATPRMKKMDDDVAQANIDQNGKDWFIEDGFLVTPQASAFNIKAGAGYVSGSRVTLEFDRNVQVPNKPSFIYVDAYREGTPTGEQVTLFDFVVTAEEKDDYTDANGVTHFVCKIAQVLADGSVSDLRPEGESRSYVNEKSGDSVSQSLGSEVYPIEITKHANIGENIPATTQSLRLLKGIGIVGVFKLYPSPASGNLDAIDFSSSTVTVGGKKHYIVGGSLDPLNPRSWGVTANGTDDDWQAWTNFFSWYYTQVSVDSSGGGTPTWTAPKIKDVGGMTLLSKPLVYLGGYINADFGRTRFKRHSAWSEPDGTFLLQFTQIYQGDMGGICNRDESYFADFGNNNLDETVFRLTGIQSKRGDWVYKFNLKSAIVYLDDYKFSDSPTPVHIERCDRFYLGKGWTTQGALDEDKRCTFQIDSAVFIACEGSLGVPKPHTGKEVAWFGCGKAGAHSKGAIDISKFRAGGEPGSCTLVNSWIEADTTYPIVPSFITIENNDLYSTDRASDTQTSCVLRLFKVPNCIRFNNNTGMPDTGRMIEWGKGVDQNQELGLLKLTSAKSFTQAGNVTGDLFNRFAPENIRDLFMSGAKVPMSFKAGSDNSEIIVDTTIVPGNGKYGIEFQANGHAGAGTQYLSSYSSFIMMKVGFSGAVVKRLEVFNEVCAAGGASFNKSFTVTPYFLDGSTELSEIDVNNSTATLRLRITGFDINAPLNFFRGFIKLELYENNL